MRLLSKKNEVVRHYKFIHKLCAEVKLALESQNVRALKCQRRALKSGLRMAEEGVVQMARAHQWTPIA
jgi:hypothetical protein